MADLMDQYDSIERTNPFLEASSSNPFLEPKNPFNDEPISSGYVNINTEEELAMFERKKFRYRRFLCLMGEKKCLQAFSIEENLVEAHNLVVTASKAPANIIDVVVANNIMAIALQNNQIQRIDINHPSEVDAIEVSKKSDNSIHKLFIDPGGRHIIISMSSSESFYLGRNNKKLKPLHKLKNHKVESVAWNKAQMTDISTGPILIGTQAGAILETEIDAEEKFLSLVQERHLKPISNLNTNMPDTEPITGLYMEKFRRLEKRYVVLASTLSRFYQFIGDIGSESPYFQPVLNIYESSFTPFQQIHSLLGYSCLSLMYPRANDVPKYFAWLTGSGVYFSTLDFSRNEIRSTINIDSRLLPSTEDSADAPVSISISEFHCLLLYENKFEAICILNDEPDFTETIPPRFGTMIGLRSDIARKTVWCFSESTVFQYHINQESRNAWKLYLEKGEYELAKDYCKQNPAQMDIVLQKQAEYFFNNKQYQEAAAYYALTQISFEEVALKFIQVKNSEALKTFLLKKFVSLKSTDKTQLTMLVTWLLELYLNDLGILRDQGKKEQEYKALNEDLQKFLNQSKTKSCLELNKQVAYDLLSSHGDTENLVFFAMLMRDYDKVIRHHIQQDDYLAALDVLKKQREDYQLLFEQFSPSLIVHIPKQLIDLWKQRTLDAKKLIPALVTQTQLDNKDAIKCAISYLEHCIYNLKNEDVAIHNYLISLYCKLDEEKPLLTYLHRQGEKTFVALNSILKEANQVPQNKKGQEKKGEIECVNYDLKYALRLCSENDKNQSAVQIYSAMGLYEEAVDLALSVSIDQAKIYADKPEYDDEFKKKLWLKVARHVVEQQQDIGKAMDLLRECPLLKIEDILPFFHDFVTIDHFKEAICDSLQEYNKHISELKDAMMEATNSAEVVRAEIHDIRSRYGTINAQEKCSLCHYPLVTRSFYYFPCTHVFHSDCLITEVKNYMKERQRAKVEDIQAKMLMATQTLENKSQIESLKEELDDYVAEECLYCGDVMIKSIDEPFIPAGEFHKSIESWI